MSHPDPDQPTVVFGRSPVPGVSAEVIRYLLTLPDEVRTYLGNFLLDSTVEGFDGTEETSARLWREELKRRIEDAESHPEKLLTLEQVLHNVEAHLEQLKRTPHPDNLHGYHCVDYFGDGWAENGYYDEESHTWVVSPLKELDPEQRFGFFAIGRPGVDGIRFGYRYGRHGLWAFYPIGEEFVFLAPTLAALVEKWRSGTITL
jgi:hypothetical protein